MRKALILTTAAALLMPAAALAQLRLPYIPSRGGPPPRPGAPPVLQGIDAARADFLAQSGSTTVYFGIGNAVLGAPAKATLAAQARWLIRHPEVVVRVEGYADAVDTRDHALAVGAARADAVRSYLMLLGIPAGQMTAVSFGKERTGPGRAVTVLVR